jgi:hypothetical protein
VVESVAWGGCWVCAAEIGLGWWVCAGFGSLPRLITVVVVVAAVGGKELLDIRVLLAVNKKKKNKKYNS